MDGKIKSKDGLICRDVGEETLVLTPENATLHTLNATGKAIWEFIATYRTLDEIAGMIAENYDCPPEEARADAASFVDELKAKGLLDVE